MQINLKKTRFKAVFLLIFFEINTKFFFNQILSIIENNSTNFRVINLRAKIMFNFKIIFNYKNILIVSIGGILGTLARYFVYLLEEYLALTNFPIGVLFINSIGSFLIGFLFAIFNSLEIYKTYKLFCFVGFLGAFTTFSAYSLNTINLFFENKFKLGFLNILLNNTLSLFFVILGFWLAKILYIFLTKNSV